MMRSQVDGLQDEFSLASGTSFDLDEDMTRQEFRDDCDVNVLLKRHGMDVPQRQVVYGEYDFDTDLSSAFAASRMAADAFDRVDPAVTSLYGDWPAVLAAVARGEVVIDGSSIRLNEQPPAGASSSEGAADGGLGVRFDANTIYNT